MRMLRWMPEAWLRPDGNEATTGAGMGDVLFAFLLGTTGVSLALPGAYLVALAGSPYYLFAGIILLAIGLTWCSRPRLAYILLNALAVATMFWALLEAGLDGWALLPRLDLLALLVGWGMLLRYRARQSWWRSGSRSGGRPWLQIGGAIVLLVAGIALISGFPDTGGAAAQRPIPIKQAAEGSDWPSMRGSPGGDQYTSLAQITPANVSGLKIAWTARLGLPPGGRLATLEATPIKIGNALYICNGNNEVLSLESDMGRIRWRFNPAIVKSMAAVRCRGVTYYTVPDASGACSARIALATIDARLFSIDAATGRPCPSFGIGGAVDLKEGLGQVVEGYLEVTSPPHLIDDKLIVGGAVLDSQHVGEPSGVIRAFDMVTGRLAWAWDMERPERPGPPPAGETYTPGTPNAWAPMTVDPILKLIYVPLGNATPDWVSSHRSPTMNRYGSSLVALDAATGRARWHFQTTHRDVWDYDVPSPPVLIDFPTPRGPIPAVVQATKRGQFFVLDRRTGSPLAPVVERPVPQGAIAGETLATTQPYSVGMPALNGGSLTEGRMWGITPFDQLWCRIKFRQARHEGEFTPVGTDRDSIIFPGFVGGSNWGGVSVDRSREIMIAAVNYFPTRNRLIPRDEADRKGLSAYRRGVPDYNNWAQQGTAYASSTSPFLSPLNMPCLQPPFSEIAAIDLATRKIMWRRPLGTARDSGPFGLASHVPLPMGVPVMGGSLATRSGLLFIGATQEKAFRAFDTRSGRLLWQVRLPAGGNANPISYRASDGRQIVLISAGGHQALGNGPGDYLIAYSLPH